MRHNVIEHIQPVLTGGIKVWTVGGSMFEGDTFVYDTTQEIITLTNANETIVVDVDLVVAFAYRPATVTP